MLNLFTSDLRRMLASRSTWILLVIFTLFFVLVTFLTVHTTTMRFEDYIASVEKEAADDGIVIRVEGESMSREAYEEGQRQKKAESTPYQMLALNLGSGSVWLLFISLFTVIFFLQPHTSGALKNYLPLQGYRWKSLVSSWLVTLTFFLLCMTIVFGASLAGARIIQGELVIRDWALIGKYLAAVTLLSMGLQSLLLLLAAALQNLLPALILGIFLSADLQGVLVGTLDTAAGTNFSSYGLAHNVFRLSTADPLSGKILLIGGISIAVYMAAGLILRSRIDLQA